MNTTKSVATKSASRTTKHVVNVALIFSLNGKAVDFAAQLECNGKSKVITGSATDKAMSTALKAITAELKATKAPVHLNVRHNHRNFQSWFFKTPGATERIQAITGRTTSCNIIKQDDLRLAFLRKVVAENAVQAETVAEPKAEPVKQAEPEQYDINSLFASMDYIDADGVLMA